ncbi:site-specific integrase [Bradyrhizobium sp.]|uniref:site-specific integrase n=1 Tax=Bradyrhizobium sp. TaxID=376 RepID=UPI0025C12C82|nr:site-specific integrase [Bradyrhizobium sp.]
MTRVSLLDDITDRQQENGAIYCDRFTFAFEHSFRDDRYLPPRAQFAWRPTRRNRYLDGGLFLKLDQACSRLTGLDRYIPLVIFLVVETGLRLEELCSVKWEDVLLDKRRLDVPKPLWPKDHEARTIVLSVRVRMYLEQLASALKADDRFDPSSVLIPITPTAIRKAFERVVSLAQVKIGESLFDALHSDAEVRFKEARLTKIEREIMLGSASRILPGSQEDLVSIQRKLDWNFLDGKTYEEAKDNLPIVPADQIISLRKLMASWGTLEIPEASPTVIRHFPNVVLRILAA